MRLFRLSTAALAAVMVAGCSSSSGAVRVAVTGANDGCEPSVAEVQAGKVTFDFTNTSDEISELYVLRADESVVGEVENVVTGVTRQLNVSLVAGEYSLVCKPGQQGEGIRGRITVVGEGGTSVGTAGRTVSVGAKDYSFELPGKLEVTAGETIRFEMTNSGTVEHEMEVIGPDGVALGEVGPTPVGKTGQVTLTFREAGDYHFVCGIKDAKTGVDHERQGMVSRFDVI